MKAARTRAPAETRERLIGATLRLMLRQGFAGTSVDQICAEAGLTKGSFFHHFPAKDAICQAALDAWASHGAAVYAQAFADPGLDPLAQLHRLLDIMSGLATSRDEACTCLVGMMAQELAATNPALRATCAQHLGGWTAMVARLLVDAKRRHRPRAAFEPQRVAWFINSLWQGSMLVAKARQDPAIIRGNLELARAWLDGLFTADTARRKP